MENLNKQIQELQKIIDTYGNIVFFGGEIGRAHV